MIELNVRAAALRLMGTAIRYGFLLLSGVLCLGTSPGESRAQTVDWADGAQRLARAKFDIPESTARWQQPDDGLPAPQDPRFEVAAAEFLAKHPEPPPGEIQRGLWDARQATSRQWKCLAHLSATNGTADVSVSRLCIVQAESLQWTLPMRGAADQTLYAAVGAQALLGQVLRDAFPHGSISREAATQWLRTAAGQLATYGAKGDASSRKMAQDLVDHSGILRGPHDAPTTDEAFFAQLDLTRPDMTEVARHAARSDWRAAQAAYVTALAERFSTRRGWPDVNHWRTVVDLPEADDICRNVFLLQAHMFRRYDFGAEVDWTKVIDNDIESRVWMNAHPWMWQLLNAYQTSGDEKYIVHLCRLFNSWYDRSPVTFARSSAQWRTLEAGGRAGQRWPPILLTLAEHPMFREQVLLNMARSMLDHGNYLATYASSGRNWLQVESSGLACVGLLFPEFKLSPLFYEVGMNRLAWINAQDFLPDGFQSECSPGYHRFPLLGIATSLRLAKFLGRPVPESLLRQYEAGVTALQDVAYPDLDLPLLNDFNPQMYSAVEVLQIAADVFPREDFRWFASGGQQGLPPPQPSHDFTHAGYCVMRDRWGPDGQVLIFDAGYFGSGHQHDDKLHFVFYAGGRELIGDPCIYSYKRDEFEPYWRGTWSHNTVTIDDLSQDRRAGPAEPIPDPDRRFVMGEEFDFAVGWYRRAYSPRGAPLWGEEGKAAAEDRAATIRDVQHQRCVFFVKGNYAVIADRIVGQGSHQVDILFHPAPIVTGEGTRRAARAAKLEIRPDGSAVTRESEYANVAILPASRQQQQVLQLVGQNNPVRGWYALYGIVPSPDLVYRSQAQLPAQFAMVVQPLSPGEAEPMHVRPCDVTVGGGGPGIGVECGDDTFLLSYDGAAEMQSGEVAFHGTALLLRRMPDGERLAWMVDGRRLSLGKQEVFATGDPRPAASIVLDP